MVSKMAQGMGQDGNQDGLATREMGHLDLSVGSSWRFREVFSEGFLAEGYLVLSNKQV